MGEILKDVFKGWDNTTTLVFFSFFVPGFISMQVWRILFPFVKDGVGIQLAEVLGFGALNYGLTLPLITLAHYYATFDPKHPHGWAIPVSFYVATFVVPTLTPFAVYLVRYLVRFGALNPTPKPWDYVFSQGKLLWIALELTNGDLVGGKYGTKSFASSFPNDEQIYLEEAWEVAPDLSFKRRLDRSAGILVNGADVRRMHFFK